MNASGVGSTWSPPKSGVGSTRRRQSPSGRASATWSPQKCDGGYMRGMNRWVIAAAGVFLQIALGAVYAWSVFRIPLARQFGWSIPEVTLTFTISIFTLGIASFFGGLWLNRRGPRIVALTGGILYGL